MPFIEMIRMFTTYHSMLYEILFTITHGPHLCSQHCSCPPYCMFTVDFNLRPFKTIFETLRVCYSLNESKVAFCKTGFTFVILQRLPTAYTLQMRNRVRKEKLSPH